jgi:hypothetical protein
MSAANAIKDHKNERLDHAAGERATGKAALKRH